MNGKMRMRCSNLPNNCGRGPRKCCPAIINSDLSSAFGNDDVSAAFQDLSLPPQENQMYRNWNTNFSEDSCCVQLEFLSQ